MVLNRWSAAFMFALLVAGSAEFMRTEIDSSSHGRNVRKKVEVQLHSHGQSALVDVPNWSRHEYYGLCNSHDDCQHSDTCDVEGTMGCGNRCVGPADKAGHRRCMTTVVGEKCAHDYECVTGRCDTDDWYGCKNVCLSEQVSEGLGRHCKTRPMGEPCDNDKQCLSGVCDSNSTWGSGCHGLCVSELDEAGYNRHCNPKQVAETCAHDLNCDGGTVCDVSGLIEEHGRCQGRCITESTDECHRQHCSPNCPVCLSNLTARPRGSSMNHWTGYPAHRVSKDDQTHEWHMELKENQETELRLRIPASCVEDDPCIEVKGKIEVIALNGAKLSMQSGLYTGFPSPKPAINAMVDGVCPERDDGFPQAGHNDCCYAPSSVSECKSSPYSKGCERFLAGKLQFGSDGLWGYQSRLATDTDNFDQSTNQNRFSHGDFEVATDPPRLREFNVEIDFAAEKYKYFQFGGKSWYMDEPVMTFGRDRNCKHINEWPEASFEFSLHLSPQDGDNTPNATVKLTHLEVNRKKSCRVQKHATATVGSTNGNTNGNSNGTLNNTSGR